jgi:hypothetical protein
VADSLVVTTTSNLASGQYPFTVNLSDGVVTQNLAAAFSIGDFSLSISPATQTLGSTDSTSFTLNVQSINGYSQPIQITCSGLPAGTACPFNSAVFAGANFFQIQTQNAASGTYTFTLTGTSGGLVRTASAQLTVTSGTFTGSVSPTTATITVGSSQNFTVKVSSTGGFQGQVNLACNTPVGLTCQFTSTQVNLSSGGSASATFSIGVTSSPGILTLDLWRNFESWRVNRSLKYLLLILGGLIVTWIRTIRRGRDSMQTWRPAWTRQAVFGALLLLALAISSCGGAGGSVSGEGGGGGGGTITSVSVQGTAGGTSVTLGTVTVTIP